VILVFEAARRILGLALPIICGAFLLYGLFGQYLPGAIAHRGYGFDQIVNQLGFGTEGIFGIPTLCVGHLHLPLHPVRLLSRTCRNDQSVQLAGAGLRRPHQGRPGQGLGDFLGLMGTISGSGVANVLTTGQFTIPLMKKFGYSGVFAGAVEATSSRWAARSCRR
jgi:TRAP-type uncharacterized transport system fused permease subunit